jgi:hypothetical protein
MVCTRTARKTTNDCRQLIHFFFSLLLTSSSMSRATYLMLPRELRPCLFQPVCALRETCKWFCDLLDVHRAEELAAAADAQKSGAGRRHDLDRLWFQVVLLIFLRRERKKIILKNPLLVWRTRNRDDHRPLIFVSTQKNVSSSWSLHPLLAGISTTKPTLSIHPFQSRRRRPETPARCHSLAYSPRQNIAVSVFFFRSTVLVGRFQF